ncbi:MAG: hypothetical protein LQ343_005594 [Gyalolechia ehrenbergii]|nr:MAG: hypothetical protein LQ343_005594 [Gyalolechia ehrenbergii]
MSEIILYDIPSKDRCAAWSPSTWKSTSTFFPFPSPQPPYTDYTPPTSIPARLILNYKHIPYTTHWLEFPSIAPHLQSLSIPPNPSGSPIPYTLPAIRLPDGTPIMDSKRIALALEDRYPNPPLHLSSPQLTEIEDHVLHALRTLFGFTLPKTPRVILNKESRAYYSDKLSKRFGTPLEQFEQENSGDGKWEELRPFLKRIGEMLREQKGGGPFLKGVEEVTYADLVVVGLLHYFRRLEGGVYERVVGMEPALGELYRACGEWWERDD